MQEEIKIYLNLTRGRRNYQASKDEVLDALVSNYQSTLEKNNIDVIAIYSNVAKNELITLSNGRKTLIWDTNYWIHFAYYYNNLRSLEQHIVNNTSYAELECDALWRDLFRVAFLRVNKNCLKSQLQYIKYYLSYGMRSYPFRDPEKSPALSVYESMVDVANAKWYAFLHEIGHVTAGSVENEYAKLLMFLFSEEMRTKTYDAIVETDPLLSQSERDRLTKRLDELHKELCEENYTNFQEIIADMRAFHSLCTFFAGQPSETMVDGFVQCKCGVVIQRSFNLRIRNIEACLRETSGMNDISVFREKLMQSQFGTDFFIRDKMYEITEIILMQRFFRMVGNREMIEKYLSKAVYSRKTAETIGQTIGEHLEKLYKRIKQEENVFTINISQADEIIDYLLYYPAEKIDHASINLPRSRFGWTGLLFDDVVVAQSP